MIVEGLDNAAYEIGVDRNNLLYLIERGYITPCPRNKGQKYKFILDDLLEGYEKRKQEIIDTMRENNDWGE